MRQIGILIAERSPVLRRMIADAVTAEPDMVVLGTSVSARNAFEQARVLQPDVLTLDVEDPEFLTPGTLERLLHEASIPGVVGFSGFSPAGTHARVEARIGGITELVVKPDSLSSALTTVRHELIPKLRRVALGRGVVRTLAVPTSAPESVAASLSTSTTRRLAPAECVVIGISTGGPRALEILVPALPANLPVPVLVVQHMPDGFIPKLAERLSSKSSIPVAEAKDKEPIVAGRVYLAPGGRHLSVSSAGKSPSVVLLDTEVENWCRPAADVLFRSAVRRWHGRVLAIVMTGMGTDGTRSTFDVIDAGGRVVIQDAASSVVWGMPGSVARAGLATIELPLSEIAGEIVRSVAVPRVSARAVGSPVTQGSGR